MSFRVKWVGGDCGDGRIWYRSHKQVKAPRNRRSFEAEWVTTALQAASFKTRDEAQKIADLWGAEHVAVVGEP